MNASRSAGRAILLVLLASMSALGCNALRDRLSNGRTRDAGTSVVGAMPAPTALPIGPRARRAAIATAYRLGTDRRFVHAAAVLGELGAPAAASTFEGIEPLADFDVLSERLARLAATIPKDKLALPGPAGPPSESTAPFSFGDAAMTSLRTAQEAWGRGEHTRAHLATTARALSSLAFQTDDQTLELADDVGARALAIHALADANEAGLTDTDHAILAESLGYGAAASRFAAKLPPRDPLRAYLEFDYPALREAAHAQGASATTRLLWIYRADEARGVMLASSEVRMLFERDAMKYGAVRARAVALAGLESRPLVASGPTLALLELAAMTGDRAAAEARDRMKRVPNAEELETTRRVLALDAGDEIPKLESLLARLAAPGPLVPASVPQAHYQAAVMGAIARAFRLELDTYGSREAARAYLDARHPGADPVSKDVLTALGVRAEIAERRGGARFVPAIAALPALGGAPRITIFEDLRRYADWGDTSLARAARLVAANTDGRPRHRGPLAVIAHETMDLAESERLLDAALRVAPMSSPRYDAWAAERAHDSERLRRAIGDPRFSAVRRAELLARALEGAPDDAGLRALVDAVVGEQPAASHIRTELAGAYLRAKRPEAARALLEPWLAKYEDETLESAAVRRLIAESLLAEGRPADAQRVIAKAARTGQFDALEWAARTELALGNTAGAESLGTSIAQRYPGSHAGATLSLLRFLAGDASGGAKTLRQEHVTYVDARFWVAREVVPELLQKPGRAEAALDAVAALGDIAYTTSFTAEAMRAKRPEVAFATLAKVRAPGMAQLEIGLEAYKAKQAAEGDAAALAWLDQRVPAAMRPELSMFAFAHDAPAVFDLVPEKAGYDHDNVFTWLMRASMILAHGRDKHPRFAATEAFFRDAPPSKYAAFGKMLFGLADEASVEPFVTNEKDSCEAAFYLAHKADVEGRRGDAAAYYRVSVESGSVRDGEYRWSYDRLYAMREAEHAASAR